MVPCTAFHDRFLGTIKRRNPHITVQGAAETIILVLELIVIVLSLSPPTHDSTGYQQRRKTGCPDRREFVQSSILPKNSQCSLQLRRHEVSCSCWNLACTRSLTGLGEGAVAMISD